MEFTDGQKRILLWASFGALMAAGFGFVFRAMVPQLWGLEFHITDSEVGQLFGAGLWPIAVMMILNSFLIDKIGYKASMLAACFFQTVSIVLTLIAGSFEAMWWACFFAGVGHGMIESAINPLCISIYRTEKTKAMNILHASWPAGLMAGGAIFLSFYSDADWATAKTAWIFMLLPVIGYGTMFTLARKFPVDERVENNVPMIDMLREYGGLGMFLAVTFLGYELFNQLDVFGEGQYTRLTYSLVLGIVGGGVFGFAVKSKGKVMFFFLCLIMIPLATAEIATDGWIQNLMRPTMGQYSGWALVFSAFIMMILRFGSGIPLKLTGGPLGLLLTSSIFSIVGLFALSYVDGVLVFFAFVFYAVGQTYYWPSILGFTSERFPKGGALTLNTVSAIGLLTVGVFGFPFLGAVQDHYNAKSITQAQPALVQTVQSEGRVIEGTEIPIYDDKNLFGVSYSTINPDAFMAQPDFPAEDKESLAATLTQTGRSTLRVAAVLPISMAIGFALIMLWFRANGGYKPIILGQEE